MNLNNNPTPEQLRELLRPLDDRAAHHVLWVDWTGEVHVTAMERKAWRAPPPPPEVVANAAVCVEPFWAGNGYVGPDGAANDEWITDAFNWLLRDWVVAKGSGSPAEMILI